MLCGVMGEDGRAYLSWSAVGFSVGCSVCFWVLCRCCRGHSACPGVRGPCVALCCPLICLLCALPPLLARLMLAFQRLGLLHAMLTVPEAVKVK